MVAWELVSVDENSMRPLRRAFVAVLGDSDFDIGPDLFEGDDGVFSDGLIASRCRAGASTRPFFCTLSRHGDKLALNGVLAGRLLRSGVRLGKAVQVHRAGPQFVLPRLQFRHGCRPSGKTITQGPFFRFARQRVESQSSFASTPAGRTRFQSLGGGSILHGIHSADFQAGTSEASAKADWMTQKSRQAMSCFITVSRNLSENQKSLRPC